MESARGVALDKPSKFIGLELYEMGSWGPNNFDNDDALDWIAELRRWHQVHEAMTLAAINVEACSAANCSQALAAAEQVAASASGELARLPASAKEWVAANRSGLDQAMVALAVTAVSNIANASSLQRMADDGARDAAWHTVQDKLKTLTRVRKCLSTGRDGSA